LTVFNKLTQLRQGCVSLVFGFMFLMKTKYCKSDNCNIAVLAPQIL